MAEELIGAPGVGVDEDRAVRHQVAVAAAQVVDDDHLVALGEEAAAETEPM